MRTISYTEARQNLSATMVQTVEDRAPTLITRQNGEACVGRRAQQVSRFLQRVVLLQRHQHARRLMDSIDSLKRGQGVERNIAE